jgi:diphthine-ammonia ligase
MRVVVLVSGGKDSTCNMLKCVEHGHDIVALANLHPPRDAPSDELDSFMYQSVGHELIEAYAQCMRVPLYRRAIRGSSRVTSMQYAPTDAADEVEDLFELLRDVCRAHAVDAVACGTILSSYQRIRVENVCARLGLLALAFLWQREQSALLDEMLDRHAIDAVLIKTAAIGLGKAQLGRPLGQVRDTLRQLARQYGVHVCGEGGEYESFTLDCPLFHSRIVLDECTTVVHSADEFAPVLYLRCSRFHLEDKPADSVRPAVRADGSGAARSIAAFVPRDAPARAPLDASVRASVVGTMTRAHSILTLSNVHVTARDVSLADQVNAGFEYCFEHLRSASASLVYVSLYLRDMSDYVQVNAVYNALFGANPPSRTTVALGAACLAPDAALAIDVVATVAPVNTLHVQSISEWAPASIGPYSQAQTIGDSLLLLAGQIGLVPATLQLDGDALQSQFVRAANNCVAVVATLAECSSAAAARALFRHCVVYVSNAVNDDSELRALVADLPCASTIVRVAGLPRAAVVELQVVAARRESSDVRQQCRVCTTVAELEQGVGDGAACWWLFGGRAAAASDIDRAQRHMRRSATLVDAVNGDASAVVAIVLHDVARLGSDE